MAELEDFLLEVSLFETSLTNPGEEEKRAEVEAFADKLEEKGDLTAARYYRESQNISYLLDKISHIRLTAEHLEEVSGARRAVRRLKEHREYVWENVRSVTIQMTFKEVQAEKVLAEEQRRIESEARAQAEAQAKTEAEARAEVERKHSRFTGSSGKTGPRTKTKVQLEIVARAVRDLCEAEYERGIIRITAWGKGDKDDHISESQKEVRSVFNSDAHLYNWLKPDKLKAIKSINFI